MISVRVWESVNGEAGKEIEGGHPEGLPPEEALWFVEDQGDELLIRVASPDGEYGPGDFFYKKENIVWIEKHKDQLPMPDLD